MIQLRSLLPCSDQLDVYLGQYDLGDLSKGDVITAYSQCFNPFCSPYGSRYGQTGVANRTVNAFSTVNYALQTGKGRFVVLMGATLFSAAAGYLLLLYGLKQSQWFRQRIAKIQSPYLQRSLYHLPPASLAVGTIGVGAAASTLLALLAKPKQHIPEPLLGSFESTASSSETSSEESDNKSEAPHHDEEAVGTGFLCRIHQGHAPAHIQDHFENLSGFSDAAEALSYISYFGGQLQFMDGGIGVWHTRIPQPHSSQLRRSSGPKGYLVSGFASRQEAESYALTVNGQVQTYGASFRVLHAQIPPEDFQDLKPLS